MAGDTKIGLSQSVYLSERGTAYRNYALAYYMKSHSAFPEDIDFNEATDFYLQSEYSTPCITSPRHS